ncbi:hypothetical protein [Streptomyces roseus]|nr:hypothetical protein [Streptomyces roseus]
MPDARPVIPKVTGTDWSVRDGLVTFDEPAVVLMAELDAVFIR